MKMVFKSVMLVALTCAPVAIASAIEITSNNFDAFAATIASAPSGTSVTFNLGANSTIHFAHPITVPNNLTFVGGGNVTFDGDGTSSLFIVPTSETTSFSGFTFQNGSAFNGGGAIDSEGQTTIHDSSFFHNNSGNVGGAIGSLSAAHGNVSIYGSVFAYNHAINVGGAIEAGSFIQVENSTFFSNSAGNGGGAIDAGSGSNFLRNVTIYNNAGGQARGGGVSAGPFGTLQITSSLIAGNSEMDIDCSIPFQTTYIVRNSLVGNPTGSGLLNSLLNGINKIQVGDGATVSGFPISGLLGPLTNNGGLTQTMALLDFNGMINPAIDAGSNPDRALYDQRGAPFARNSGLAVDIGAFERQAPEPSAVVLAGLGFAILLVYRRCRGFMLSPRQFNQ